MYTNERNINKRVGNAFLRLMPLFPQGYNPWYRVNSRYFAKEYKLVEQDFLTETGRYRL